MKRREKGLICVDFKKTEVQNLDLRSKKKDLNLTTKVLQGLAKLYQKTVLVFLNELRQCVIIS
ncbi:Predicted protein [Mesomycoplasma hyopneumoniae 168]|uniref:Uncharacterized protein n=1 Tax=Mesomycoplasma hyopneumoniae (strain 168) TaxID=907287 RepID=E4QTK0_MESH1|nr:Predicted protein [Mesomycoplasma hyopneumoniae 168]